MRKRRGASQASTRPEREAESLPGRAARVVDDAALLREVLRRACLIEPELVRAMLADAELRLRVAREGGYVERFGR